MINLGFFINVGFEQIKRDQGPNKDLKFVFN